MDRIETIERLKLAMEEVLKTKIRTPKQFNYLRNVIYNRTGELLGASTLMRIWGYVDGISQTRDTTLTILAKTIGYAGWDDFVERQKDFEENKLPSLPVLSRCINVMSELKEGDKIKLYWQPDRECVIQLVGDCMFEVLESRNTRLQPGNTFHCHIIVEGSPLYLSDLKQEGCEPVGYVCGCLSGGMHYEFPLIP